MNVYACICVRTFLYTCMDGGMFVHYIDASLLSVCVRVCTRVVVWTCAYPRHFVMRMNESIILYLEKISLFKIRLFKTYTNDLWAPIICEVMTYSHLCIHLCLRSFFKIFAFNQYVIHSQLTVSSFINLSLPSSFSCALIRVYSFPFLFPSVSVSWTYLLGCFSIFVLISLTLLCYKLSLNLF